MEVSSRDAVGARVLLVACALLAPSYVASQEQGQAPAPKPLVPAAANSIAENPEAFYGQHVTVTAAVERILSPTAFTIDQDPQGSAADVLVLAETLNAPLTPNSYITVIGEVVRQDGRPAIRAMSVITKAMIDIAKRPLTPEEEAFDKVMKRIGPAFNALRRALGDPEGADLAAPADELKAAFAETEAFWKTRSVPDAEKWAAEAREQAELLARAVKAEKWDDGKAAASALQQTCSSCHGAYRQRQTDGSYRIRMGSR